MGIADDWLKRQYREHNKEADLLATRAIMTASNFWTTRPLPSDTSAIYGHFDGGKRDQGSGTGWWLAAGSPIWEGDSCVGLK